MLSRTFRTLAAAAALAAAGAWAQAPVVPGEPARAAGAESRPTLRLPAAKADRPAIRLSDISDTAEEMVREANARSRAGPFQRDALRVVVGVVRGAESVPESPRRAPLAWSRVAGGHAAQVSIASPGAEAMRLAIDLAGVPTDVEMVFFGSAAPARLEGPVRVGDIRDRTQPWWTPVTEGESQTVEFFVPERHDPAAISMRVAQASHLVAGPSTGFAKRLEDIGTAGSCNVDVPCSNLYANPSFRDVAESTAQMVFTDGPFTALCSGTLLNDSAPNSQVPYFFSANHCFENETGPFKSPAQMQAVANSLTTIWGFQAGACGVQSPRSGWYQLGGGATVLYNNAHTDTLFLRLNADPPTGAFFSGWDANPLGGGAGVVAIHHPQGDLKKVTQGSVLGFSTPGVGGGNASFVESRWASGTTEVGSSGGGLWTAAGGTFHFRGALWGGSASCANPSGSDHYSRFDQAYPALAGWLGATGGTAIDYTDLWWNPNESGWGLNLIQHPSRTIFATWYTYAPDGKRTWFTMSSGTWTSANTYTGTLYSTSGPHFLGSFDASKVTRDPVGTATLTFNDANNATFTYSVNGVTGTKQITRQPF